MKKAAWNGLTTLSAIGGATLARQIATKLWRGSEDPPLNPADRRVDWREAMLWAVLSGLGAGIMRMLSRRATAAGWEKVVGETPPGVATAT